MPVALRTWTATQKIDISKLKFKDLAAEDKKFEETKKGKKVYISTEEDYFVHWCLRAEEPGGK